MSVRGQMGHVDAASGGKKGCKAKLEVGVGQTSILIL